MARDSEDAPLGGDVGLPGTATVSTTRNWSLISRLVLGAAIAGLFLVFVLQNAEKTAVKFLVWDNEVPTSLLMLLCAAVGVVIWQLAGFISRRARR